MREIKGENLRILFLGAANDIHTVKWVNELVKKGLEVYLVYCKDQAPKSDLVDFRVKQYPLKYSSPMGYYLNFYELKKLVSAIRPSIINAHYASGYGTLLRLCNFQPCVLSVLGSDIYEFPHRNNHSMNLIRKNLDFPNAISSTSHIMAEQVIKLSKWNLSEINIVPFGIDLELFNKKENFEINPDIKIGIVKKLKRNYGIHHVIQAFDQVQQKIAISSLDIKLSLDIYGEGPEREELQKLINELKLNDYVKLKGYIPNHDLPEVMEKFDLCVLGSAQESFGVSAIEALAMGVPLIATDTDGFLEVLDKGEFGVIVSKISVAEMAEAMFSLITDASRRRDYSKKGRSHVEKKYNWSENVDEMINLYLDTIDKYNRINK